MIPPRVLPGLCGIPSSTVSARLVLLAALWCVAAALPEAVAQEGESPSASFPTNVALFVVPREVLFFGAQAGAWTSVKLDPGERVLRRASDGNVAVVVTSLRAIGFSAPLNVTDEIRVPDDESIEAFKVAGDLATVLTRRRALGFSVFTGRWTPIDRFLLGR
ncbi:MAG TPA: hypothetical protein VLT62_17355 [Candidatus Methylomirabilis sp.]|nr:hypothetical protein [Candidatus Methylomirabilis sp.]